MRFSTLLGMKSFLIGRAGRILAGAVAAVHCQSLVSVPRDAVFSRVCQNEEAVWDHIYGGILLG